MNARPRRERPLIAFFDYPDVFEDFYPHYGIDQRAFATRWTGTGNHAVSIQDVISIVYYIGTKQGGAPNANSVTYDSDLDADGVADGREYDRTPSTTGGEPWRSRQPNGAVSIQDALVALQQVGTIC